MNSNSDTICTACGCNENGIEGGCNDEGICNCTVGYTGDTCYKCAVGYYELYPGYCMECECYSNGTQLCDVKTGNCFCELGYMGDNCRECADGYFDSNSGTFNLDPNCTGNQMYNVVFSFSMVKYFNSFHFIECECYPDGSLQCNMVDGYCNCREGYSGMLCNECDLGYYSLTTGSSLNCIGNIISNCVFIFMKSI